VLPDENERGVVELVPFHGILKLLTGTVMSASLAYRNLDLRSILPVVTNDPDSLVHGITPVMRAVEKLLYICIAHAVTYVNTCLVLFHEILRLLPESQIRKIHPAN
jgi:hypothetical protein